jgi:aryl-alcohol dehydrogenase-like predicted oxidoreductase
MTVDAFQWNVSKAFVAISWRFAVELRAFAGLITSCYHLSVTTEHDFRTPRVLGRSGLTVGRLGLASSYGAPAAAFERAFEQCCNYFYWGSIRTAAMAEAIHHLANRHREKLVVVLQSYSRRGWRLTPRIESGLRALKLDYADILLLGLHNAVPRDAVMDAALRLKERGRVRHIAVSAHHRPIFQQFAKDARFEVLMLRYNAAHRGAEQQVFPYLRTDALPRPGVASYTATRWGTLINPRYTPPGLRTPTATDCYRFALSHPDVDVCLTGPASAAELDANLRALELGPLSPEEMQWMRTVGDRVHQLTARRSLNPFMQRTQ